MPQGLYSEKMAYNPDEPRDYHGRWTSGGDTLVPAAAHEIAAAQAEGADLQPAEINTGRIRAIVDDVAKKLNFDPAKISISHEDNEFTLNGAKRMAAGIAKPTGEAVIYDKHVTPETVAGVAAHEIMHEKYFAFLADYRKEYDAMMKDPGPPPDPNGQYWWQKKGGTDAIMNPDGTLKGDYANKYPIYNAYQEITNGNNWDKMKKLDGVSDYSRD